MADLRGGQRSSYVRRMFARIAHRYDFINRLITFGQDLRWRRDAIRRLPLHHAEWLLDLGTGTGDIALLALAQAPGARIIACDFVPEMMYLGRARQGGDRIHWVLADALHLPFKPGVFDGVASAFVMRNVASLEGALHEQHRVIRQGGTIVSLETTPSPRRLAGLLMRFYTHRIVPLLGRIFAADHAAYEYLTRSTEGFLEAEELAQMMRTAGFLRVNFTRYMLGAVAIHHAEKGP